MSDYPVEDELALVLIVPHTTALRGNRWEFACAKPYLKSGVFHLQQLQPVSLPRLAAKLGALTVDEFRTLKRHLITPSVRQMNSDVVISVENLGRRYPIRHQRDGSGGYQT